LQNGRFLLEKSCSLTKRDTGQLSRIVVSTFSALCHVIKVGKGFCREPLCQAQLLPLDSNRPLFQAQPLPTYGIGYGKWFYHSFCHAFAKPLVKTPFAKPHLCHSILIDPFAKLHLYHSLITDPMPFMAKMELCPRISRTTSTTLPNRIRLGPKVPS